MLRKMGLRSIVASPEFLLLDIDSEADDEKRKVLETIADGAYGLKLLAHWPSKSHSSENGKFGHHYVYKLSAPLDIRERLVLQACLGSDRKRELLALIRVAGGIEEPSILFRPVIKKRPTIKKRSK